MKLKKADIHDSSLLFAWANDDEVRNMSFSTKPIEFLAHEKWFANKLADKNCVIYIGFNEKKEPVGQVRFDLISAGEAEVDIHINPKLRGKGWGTALLKLAVNNYLNDNCLTAVHAWIKVDNVKSFQVFRRAGFAQRNKKMIQETLCYHLIKFKSK